MAKNETTVPAVTTGNTDIASTAFDFDFSKVEGQGLENITASDISIPRITILQDLSPQVKSQRPEYLAGSKAGDICDVGTGEIFESPLFFLPVHFMKQYLEWAPRGSGRGLIAVHNDRNILNNTITDPKNNHVLPNGNFVQETAQFFGLNLSADGRKSFISFKKTGLKQAKKWLTLASSERLVRKDGTIFTPPLYYRVYKLSVGAEQSAQGDWFGFKIERGPSVVEYDTKDYKNICAEAQNLRDSLIRGEAVAQEDEPSYIDPMPNDVVM